MTSTHEVVPVYTVLVDITIDVRVAGADGSLRDEEQKSSAATLSLTWSSTCNMTGQPKLPPSGDARVTASNEAPEMRVDERITFV